MGEGKLNIHKQTGNYHFKIRLLSYDDCMKVAKHLRDIDGYSYVTTGAFVVEGTALQLESMINFMEDTIPFNSFEFVDMCDMHLGNSNEVKEMMRERIRNEKIDKLV